MGPASLPTPLSPARGRFGLQLLRQAAPPAFLSALGARCLRRVQLLLTYAPLAGPRFPAPLCFAVRHRRSRRHPTVLRDSLAWFRVETLFRADMPLGKAETVVRVIGKSSTDGLSANALSYSYCQPVLRP